MQLIFVDNLRQGMIVAQDIESMNAGVLSLVTRDTVLTDTMIQALKHRGVRFIYVKEYTAPIRRREGIPAGKRIMDLPVIPKKKPIISRKLREESLVALQDVFNSIALAKRDIPTPVAQVVEHLDSVVSQLVDSLLLEKDALVNINDLKSYDEYTFHHSLSVAVLSLAIAQRLGFNKALLNRIGMCAIMHDIGKTFIPIEIINKPSRLDDSEFRLMQEHPPSGYDYLIKSEIGDEEIWQGVLSHHEKINGTGYPDGRKGEEIPLWSRIISVADVYDALTSNRPYRTPMQPSEALEYVMGGIDSAFDYDIVGAFVKKLELYPVGSYVELSDGRIAVVLNNESQMRPVVRIEPGGEILDMLRDKSAYNVVVARLMPDGFHPVLR